MFRQAAPLRALGVGFGRRTNAFPHRLRQLQPIRVGAQLQLNMV
jgi:hypothetical protein